MNSRSPPALDPVALPDFRLRGASAPGAIRNPVAPMLWGKHLTWLNQGGWLWRLTHLAFSDQPVATEADNALAGC